MRKVTMGATGVLVVLLVGLAAWPEGRQRACEVADKFTGRSECLRYGKGEKYAAFVRRAKLVVTKDFHDPGSAQWRGLFISKSEREGPVLCGEVNAKNHFGAYVGFRPFFVPDEEEGLREIGTSSSDSLMRTMMPLYCGMKVEDVASDFEKP